MATGPTPTGRLEGKVAIVTGAARGQGAAEAARFVSEGAHVFGADVLAADGVHHLDVCSAASWEALVGQVVAEHGRIDVLVNNAAIHRSSPIADMDEGEFRRVLDVNLVGPFLGIQAVVPHMPRGASIVNVASLNGLAAQPGTSAYTASKFGVRGLTRAAALDLGPAGIRVNAILPGVIRTPMIATIVEQREPQLAAGHPLGRIGEPTDVASAAVFLASEESSWMTGSDVVVDGGLMAATPRPG